MKYDYEIWWTCGSYNADELEAFEVGETFIGLGNSSMFPEDYMYSYKTYDEAVAALNTDPRYMNTIVFSGGEADVYETALHIIPLDEDGYPADNMEHWIWDYHSDKTVVEEHNGRITVFDTFEEAKKYALEVMR